MVKKAVIICEVASILCFRSETKQGGRVSDIQAIQQMFFMVGPLYYLCLVGGSCVASRTDGPLATGRIWSEGEKFKYDVFRV